MKAYIAVRSEPVETPGYSIATGEAHQTLLSIHRSEEGAKRACLSDARQMHNDPVGEILWTSAAYGPEDGDGWMGYWSTETKGSFANRLAKVEGVGTWWETEEQRLEP